MKSLALAVMLLVAVLHGVQGANKALDAECDPDADTCTDATLQLVCDTLVTPSVCKIKVDQDCNTPSTNNNKCVTGAACDTAGGSPSNQCKCGSGQTATASKICAADGKFGGACTDGPNAKGTCEDPNAECSGDPGTCTCKTGYTGTDGKGCDLNPNVVGGSCTVTGVEEAFTQGTCTDSNAVCTDKTAGTCVCKKGYTGETGGTCAVTPNTSDGSCTTTTANEKGSCKDSMHQCSATTNGVCNCKTGYQKETGSGCKLKVEISGEDCTASGVVCVDNSECDATSKQCKCKTGYKKDGDVCGAADNTLDGSCTTGSCTDSNAECTSSTCSCKTNYGAPVEKCKLQVGVSGVDCTTTGNECVEYSSCGNNKQCSCNANFNEVSGICVPDDNKFGGKCSISTTMVGPKGTCSDANAVCDYGTCLCKENYKGTPGGGCASGASSLVTSALALFLMPAAYLLATIY